MNMRYVPNPQGMRQIELDLAAKIEALQRRLIDETRAMDVNAATSHMKRGLERSGVHFDTATCRRIIEANR